MFTPATIENHIDPSINKNSTTTSVATKTSKLNIKQNVTVKNKTQVKLTTYSVSKTTKRSNKNYNKIILKNTDAYRSITKPNVTTTPQKSVNRNNQVAFEATWYEGSASTYGYSGRTLISGFSVSSNYFPQGTLIKVEGSGLDGIYRVDDKGSMSNNVIDFFYNYGEVPNIFRQIGRVSIVAYINN